MRDSIQYILRNYQQGIFDSLQSKNGLVGEYLDGIDDGEEARLLCQTRCIFFLVKHYELLENELALSLAIQLYQNTKLHYASDSGWKRFPSATQETLDLYELAFVSYSLTSLFNVTRDEEVQADAKFVFLKLMTMIERNDFFPAQVTYKGLVSQNPLMHLYESFVSGYVVFKDDRYSSTANRLLSLIEQHFYDDGMGYIHEVIANESSSQWSEPGHSFEWVSLLTQALSNGIDTASKITPDKLLSVAERQGVTEDGFVRSTFSASKNKQQEPYRIWPQLERARAFYEAGISEQGHQCMRHVLTHFFNSDGQPLEYVGGDLSDQRVKATTGYHIISCCAVALNFLFSDTQPQ